MCLITSSSESFKVSNLTSNLSSDISSMKNSVLFLPEANGSFKKLYTRSISPNSYPLVSISVSGNNVIESNVPPFAVPESWGDCIFVLSYIESSKVPSKE